jgi:hypothetical protein
VLRITGIVLACLFFIAPAQARQHHAHHRHHHKAVHLVHIAKVTDVAGWWTQPAVSYAPRRAAEAIVEHPAGCPRVAFCGCGAAVRLGLGAGARHLWLAANWYKFPRSMPAPGMVAVRPHHVFVLEADLGHGVWSVFDANSGGRKTRIHARSIAGYVVVNPRA